MLVEFHTLSFVIAGISEVFPRIYFSSDGCTMVVLGCSHDFRMVFACFLP